MEKCSKCGKEVVVNLEGCQKWESSGAGMVSLIPHKCKGVK